MNNQTSNTVAHTPGPWTVHTSRMSSNKLVCAGDIHAGAVRPPTVANVIKRYDDRDAQEANARLIAAAPELLSALTRTLAALPGCASHGQYYTDAIVADIKSAIDKAS